MHGAGQERKPARLLRLSLKKEVDRPAGSKDAAHVNRLLNLLHVGTFRKIAPNAIDPIHTPACSFSN